MHDRNRAAIVVIQDFYQPKVNQFHITARGYFDITWFDVTVQNRWILAVQIL